jgi:ADP-ribose pyrophosphatase
MGEQLLERREVFCGKILRLVVDRVRLPDGSTSLRELVLHPGAVAVLPILSDEEVLLVNQYRHPVSSFLWEIPAGKLKPGENPLDCAKRELLEETGYEAASWEEIISFYTSPGFTDERITLFLARDLTRIAEPRPEEIASCRAVALTEIERWIESGEIRDAKTILALGLLLHRAG